MKLNNITIGADPELFIVNENTNQVVSAIGLIPGEKGNPWVGEDMPKGFGLETDNILAEFNIPPVKDKVNFINNIVYMQEYINKFVKNKNPELGIKCSASETVPESELQSDQAKLFGCDVDYNAYTLKENPKPKGESTNTRSAGFHIHVGYANPNIDTSISLIRYMDAYIGIPSVLKDRDTKRRSLYGKAGSFRLTDYGVEYRVLSSAMMSTSDKLDFVWNQLQQALYAVKYKLNIPSMTEIQNTINNSDVELAKFLINRYNLSEKI